MNSRPGQTSRPAGNGPVQQPTPQALPGGSTAAIIVSTRQRGNSILTHIRNMPWEYADTPADYVLGTTTCALFLSLKYHKLHPEYIYGRIRGLQGRYNLRLLLTMVDIEQHEESLKELSKTSLINNVTIILAWSAAEAGRYLELFKTYEHAAPTSIKGHQSTNFSDRLVEFVTVPRSVNKTDALGLVSNFGTIRTAINAQPEEISLIAGWGEKKVQRWSTSVREPFRSARAAKKVLTLEDNIGQPGNSAAASASVGRSTSISIRNAALSRTTTEEEPLFVENDLAPRAEEPLFVEDERAERLDEAARKQPTPGPVAGQKRPAEEDMSDGVLAALAKLRQN